jgi:hypothetical protein
VFEGFGIELYGDVHISSIPQWPCLEYTP